MCRHVALFRRFDARRSPCLVLMPRRPLSAQLRSRRITGSDGLPAGFGDPGGVQRAINTEEGDYLTPKSGPQ